MSNADRQEMQLIKLCNGTDAPLAINNMRSNLPDS